MLGDFELPFLTFFDELRGRGLTVVLGMLLGGLVAWLIARWRRMREHRSILHGDARDTVVIHQHIVDTLEIAAPGAGKRRIPASMRIRSIGQAPLRLVVPNGLLAEALEQRAWQVTSRDTLISMEGSEGSYLLETLTNFVCDRVANEPFEHDLYVMAPCCEPQELAHHQPITVILIAVEDLALFESWPDSKNIRVEHGGDGARVLTLMELAQRFRAERNRITELRQAGKRTKYMETMYLLDLALDRRTAPIPTKPVPWGRYEGVLKLMNLE